MERRDTRRCGSTRVARIGSDATVTRSHVLLYLLASVRFFFFLEQFLPFGKLFVSCKNRKRDGGEGGTVWTEDGHYIVTGLFGELSCSLAFFSSLALQGRKDERQESGVRSRHTQIHLFCLKY